MGTRHASAPLAQGAAAGKGRVVRCAACLRGTLPGGSAGVRGRRSAHLQAAASPQGAAATQAERPQPAAAEAHSRSARGLCPASP